MRSVLVLACMLLALTLLLNEAADRAPGPPGSDSGRSEGALFVLAASKGTLLPRPVPPAGTESLDQVILLGDAILSNDEGRPGLRVARVGPDLRLQEHELLDVAHEAVDRRRLEQLRRAAPPGTVLILSNRGRLLPPEAGAAEELDRSLRDLDSGARALDREPVSWALITQRGRSGWARLCEAVSHDCGVTLSTTLDGAPRPRPGEGELWRLSLEGSGQVRLVDELADAVRVDRGIISVEEAPVGGVPLPAIQVPLALAGEHERVVGWNGVPLGRSPRFRCGTGLRGADREGSEGVRFSLRIDGEEVHAETWASAPGVRSRWGAWDVDLAAHAGRNVRLELVVEPTGEARGDQALWGSPTLVYEGRGQTERD